MTLPINERQMESVAPEAQEDKILAPPFDPLPGTLRFHVRGDSMLPPFSPALVWAAPLNRTSRLGDVIVIEDNGQWCCHRCLGHRRGALLEKGDNNVTLRSLTGRERILHAYIVQPIISGDPGTPLDLRRPAIRRIGSMLLAAAQRLLSKNNPTQRVRRRDRLHNLITRTALRLLFPRRTWQK